MEVLGFFGTKSQLYPLYRDNKYNDAATLEVTQLERYAHATVAHAPTIAGYEKVYKLKNLRNVTFQNPASSFDVPTYRLLAKIEVLLTEISFLTTL